MDIAVTTPNHPATAAALQAAIRAAEQVGYAAIWAVGRVPDVRTDDDAGGQGPVPDDTPLDPVAVLATAAASSARLRLGAALQVEPACPPGTLRRALASLDLVGAGRLTVAVGSTDDRRLADLLRGADLVVARSRATRLLVAGSSPPMLTAAGTLADGWHARDVPPASLGQQWRQVREAAAEAGRDIDVLRLVVHAGIHLTSRALGADRRPYCGARAEVVGDLVAAAQAGADELVLAIEGARSLDEHLAACAELADAVLAAVAAPR